MLLWSTKIHDLIHEPRTPPPLPPKAQWKSGQDDWKNGQKFAKVPTLGAADKYIHFSLNRNSRPQKKAHYGKTTSKILTIVKEANTDDTKAQVAKS